MSFVFRSWRLAWARWVVCEVLIVGQAAAVHRLRGLDKGLALGQHEIYQSGTKRLSTQLLAAFGHHQTHSYSCPWLLDKRPASSLFRQKQPPAQAQRLEQRANARRHDLARHCADTCFMAFAVSMLMPGIDPHGFGLPGALKTQAAIELHGSAIGHRPPASVNGSPGSGRAELASFDDRCPDADTPDEPAGGESTRPDDRPRSHCRYPQDFPPHGR